MENRSSELFVSEAALFQIGDAGDHASFRVEWEIFKVETAIEASHRLIERVCEDTEAADFVGESNRGPKREQEKRASTAMTLMPAIYSKLAEQNNRDGIGAIALRRFRQMCPLDLTGTQGNIGGNDTGRGIKNNASP